MNGYWARKLDRVEFDRISAATELAVDRIITKGSDDIFRPPLFAKSIEHHLIAKDETEFRNEARKQTVKFLKASNLQADRIGAARRGLVTKDQNTFRQVVWFDPFDAVKYLATAILFFEEIENCRTSKAENTIHSHRKSDSASELFDTNFGYDSFRSESGKLSRERIGQWKVITDISNFFDRVGNHTLENHLLDIGCDKKYVTLVREMLLFWAGDRRSYGIPVGSDASRILSEAVLLDVDKELRSRGIIYVRYVDDFRIFAKTRAEALKSVEILTSLLADEGLSLNSRKTEIFQIVDPEEISNYANKFAGGEHEKIDLNEKIEVKLAAQVSGKSSISRFYREPGKAALLKIKRLNKADIIKDFYEANDDQVEQHIKLVVKYFVYAEQDVGLLKALLDRKVTSVFYICDALVKEAERFTVEKCAEIRSTVFEGMDWSKCAYPLLVPIMRVSAHPSYRDPKFVCDVVDGHLQTDSMIFFREAISLGYQCLDRARLRKLAMEVFPNVPSFVQRSIYWAIQDHNILSEDEKRPLLKNMKQHADDWFINRM